MALDITKVGLAVIKADHLLLVRKRGTISYILPGGKPERGEDDVAALCREIDEELGCRVDPITSGILGYSPTGPRTCLT
jgi:8-oxo-dGTP diphosphatase